MSWVAPDGLNPNGDMSAPSNPQSGSFPLPLDDIPPASHPLARRIGVIADGQIVGIKTCSQCLQMLLACCARCRKAACWDCDLCWGCLRVVCDTCNATPGSPFSFPGDRYMHPHHAD